VENARQQRHRQPRQTGDDQDIESGIADEKRPSLNRRSDEPKQQRRDHVNRDVSDQSHFPLRQWPQRLAGQGEPAFQTAKFLGTPVAFRQTQRELIPLQVFGRRAKCRERLAAGKSADDAILAGIAGRRRTDDVNANLARQLERTLDAIVQCLLERCFATGFHAADNCDMDGFVHGFAGLS